MTSLTMGSSLSLLDGFFIITFNQSILILISTFYNIPYFIDGIYFGSIRQANSMTETSKSEKCKLDIQSFVRRINCPKSSEDNQYFSGRYRHYEDEFKRCLLKTRSTQRNTRQASSTRLESSSTRLLTLDSSRNVRNQLHLEAKKSQYSQMKQQSAQY